MIIEVTGKCSFPDCDKAATEIAFDRRNEKEPKVYCENHANHVLEEDNPEYVSHCPNCGCGFGVN